MSGYIGSNIRSKNIRKPEEIVTKDRLKELVKSVDHRYEFDIATLYSPFKDIIEDFLDQTFIDLTEMTKGREGEEKITIEDVLFYFKMKWNINLSDEFELPTKSKKIVERKHEAENQFRKQIQEFKQKAGMLKQREDSQL